MRRKSNFEIYFLTFIAPEEAGQFFAQLFVFPLIFFVSMFIVNAIINSFIKPFPTIIWNYEIWIALPFYLFMIGYFIFFNIRRSYMNKSIALPIIIGIVLLAGLFYWFQIRPSSIKKYCNGWAGNQSGFDNKPLVTSNKNKYDILFTKCTREKGL